MYILFIILVIWLALTLIASLMVLFVAMRNIITTQVTDGGGKSYPYAVRAIDNATGAESISNLARESCDCPCHSRRSSMFPGMRCMDCINEPCDEGTV